MSESMILRFLRIILTKMQWYYRHSVLYKMLFCVSRFIDEVISTSRVVGFFTRDWQIQKAWCDSKTHAAIIFPITIIKKIRQQMGGFLENVVQESSFFAATKEIFNRPLGVSCRIWGWGLVAFVLTEGLLWLLFHTNTVGSMLIRIGGVILAVGLTYINRTVKDLYDGSQLAKFVGGFFTP